MNLLIVTIRELLEFVFIEWFGFRNRLTDTKPLSLTFPQRELLVGSTIDKLLPSASHGPSASDPEIQQFVAVKRCMVYEQPVQVFDGVIGILPYGVSVKVLVTSGRWSHIKYRNIVGWVLKDELAGETEQVRPQFLIGQYYDASTDTTKKLRDHINDEFGGGQLDHPLQDVEYIVYKLKEAGKYVSWPKERPRIAGRWQRLLAGLPGIHMSVSPTVGSVMETVYDDGTGRLSYVEAVFPDQSIIVSEIGVPEVGKYNERTLPYREWRELRPVFIQVS